MSLLNVFGVAGSALSAQSIRLNVVASNLANADSVADPSGQPYRAKQVFFEAAPLDGQSPLSQGVRVRGVMEDPAPPKMQYDPASPFANEQGYVAMPNVNVVEEMVNMISASRSYQTNVEVMNSAKQMMLKTLQIGQ